MGTLRARLIDDGERGSWQVSGKLSFIFSCHSSTNEKKCQREGRGGAFVRGGVHWTGRRLILILFYFFGPWDFEGVHEELSEHTLEPHYTVYFLVGSLSTVGFKLDRNNVTQRREQIEKRKATDPKPARLAMIACVTGSPSSMGDPFFSSILLLCSDPLLFFYLSARGIKQPRKKKRSEVPAQEGGVVSVPGFRIRILGPRRRRMAYHDGPLDMDTVKPRLPECTMTGTTAYTTGTIWQETLTG